MKQQIIAKEAMLDLLIELKRICEKNNIDYFLIGGTLLGAVRHNGFIPWDDDIDVGMLRKEYDRFIVACKNDLNPMYSLENYKEDCYNPNVYYKLKIKGTRYVEESTQKNKSNKEVFIDIFPFDNAIKNEKINKGIDRKIRTLRKLIAIKCKIGYSPKQFYKKMIYCFTKLVCIFFSKKRMIKKLIEIETQFNNEETEYAVNCNGAYTYETELFEKSVLNKTVYHKFEGIDFKIPQNYDYVLTQMYNDYMQLPPDNKRSGKHQIIDFNLDIFKTKSKIITIKENECE